MPVTGGCCVRAAAAGDGLEHEQEQNRTECGDEDAANRELVDPGAVDRAHQEAPDEGTEDAHRHRVEAAAAVVLDDPPGEPAGEQAHEDPADDAHGTTVPADDISVPSEG